jgi:hypothetical protein
VHHFDRSGRQWPADINGVAVPVGICRVMTSGGCRPEACSACHRVHFPDRRSAARRAGLDAWLAGLARDTGIFSRICRTIRRNMPLKPAL